MNNHRDMGSPLHVFSDFSIDATSLGEGREIAWRLETPVLVVQNYLHQYEINASFVGYQLRGKQEGEGRVLLDITANIR